MRSSSGFRSVERGLFLVGMVLIAVWLKGYGEASAYQSSASHRLVSTLGRIEIPRLGISAMIAEGTEPRVLARAVGHISFTAQPGCPGNVALAGHRDSFFRGLGGVHENDLIRIVTVDTTFTYRVTWAAVVGPRRVDVLDSTSTPSLTLVTCFPFKWIGPAPKRFVVRAQRADAPAL